MHVHFSMFIIFMRFICILMRRISPPFAMTPRGRAAGAEKGPAPAIALSSAASDGRFVTAYQVKRLAS